MKEIIKKEHEEVKLISLLSASKNPVKAKALGDLSQYIQGLRDSKKKLICSKPGPNGGYYLSTNPSDILRCEKWVNNWRKSMGIDGIFSIL